MPAHTIGLISQPRLRIGFFLFASLLTGVAFWMFAQPQPTQAAGVVCPRPGTHYYAADTPFGLVTGDINKDGSVDAIAINRSFRTASIFLGNGSGQFNSRTSISLGSEPTFIQLQDLNNDTNLDLLIVSRAGANISILFGTGTGSFGPPSTYAAGSLPRGAAVGDLNGDTYLDIVVTNTASSTINVFLGTSTGTFGTSIPYPVGSSTVGLTAGEAPHIPALGDLDNDNDLDIIVPTDSGGQLLNNDGSGNFTSATIYNVETNANTNTAALRDLNNDTLLDLVLVTSTNKVSVLINSGGGILAPAVNYATGVVPVGVTFGDIDGDSTLDLVTANWNSGSISMFLGNGDGSFQTAISNVAIGSTNSANLADVNNDGLLDLLALNYIAGRMTVWLTLLDGIPQGTLSINNGTSATATQNVTLNLNITRGCSVPDMAFSNDGITYSAYEPYAATKAWTLPVGDGSKTVFVQFRDAAGNVSAPISDVITLDQTAPTGTLAINNGATYTSSSVISLALSATDSGVGVTQMSISDGIATSGWLTYATSYQWSLAGPNGIKMITVRYRDALGNTSATVSSTITLDTQPPSVGVNTLPVYQTSTTFPVNVSGSDATSGIVSYDIQVKDLENGTWTDWRMGASTPNSDFTGVDRHSYRFRVRAHDAAGNTSTYSESGTTTVDATAPEPVSLLINGGALHTTSQAVTLSVQATDATSGLADMSFSNNSTTWSDWQPYQAATPWILSPHLGEKTVYARFRDQAGNISTVLDSVIVLADSVTDDGITINNGALYTNQVAVMLTLSARPGTSQMQVSNDGGFAGATWEPFSTQKAWEITQYGTSILPRIVYIRYKDINGTVFGTYQDDIILDVTGPSGECWIDEPQVSLATTDQGVTLRMRATDDISGVALMRVSSDPDFAGAEWQPYQTTLAWNIGSSRTVYVQFQDYAGNLSPAYSTSAQENFTVALPLVVR